MRIDLYMSSTYTRVNTVIVAVAGAFTRSPSVVLGYMSQCVFYTWTVYIFMCIADHGTLNVINFIY